MKNKKHYWIIAAILAVLIILTAGIIFRSIQVSKKTGEKIETEEKNYEQLASNVTDEATLRELLLADQELDIHVSDDIEVKETLVVKGTKTIKSDAVLKATFDMKAGTPILDVSKNASLKLENLVLDGNSLAYGINVNRKATLNYTAGQVLYAGAYGIVSAGTSNLKDVTVSHSFTAGLYVACDGDVYVDGGTYSDGYKHNMYVEQGGNLEIKGEILATNSGDRGVYNYGTLKIYDGVYSNSGSNVIDNRAKLVMEYQGSKKDGYIEVMNSGNAGVYSNSNSFKTTISRIHVDGAVQNTILNAGSKSNIVIKDCVLENAGGNSLSIRGIADINNVNIKDSGNGAVLIQQGADATLHNIQINSAKGRGLDIKSSSVKGENITISNIGTQGIAVRGDGKGAEGGSAELSKVSIKGSEGNNLRVVDGSVLKLKNATLDTAKSTNVYASRGGSITLDGVKVNGTTGKESYPVQVANKESSVTINAKTVITGATVRAVHCDAGTLIMNGGEVCNNIGTGTNAGIGVQVTNGATFIMKGGEIYGNSALNVAGGVRINKNSTFKMSGGSIHDNYAKNGGAGIRIDYTSNFELTGGAIYNNKSDASAGAIQNMGDFTMTGGEIYNNIAENYGGAMNVASNGKKGDELGYGSFTMKGGSIYGNTAGNGGGALQISTGTSVELCGGKITDNIITAGVGDGIRLTGKLTISDDFYLGKDKIGITSKNAVVKLAGNKLVKHDTKTPLLISPAADTEPGDIVVECDNAASAVALLNHVASGTRAYKLLQLDNTQYLTVEKNVVDLNDMTGADTVKVSTYKELKAAVEGTEAARYVVLTADIVMEGNISVPDNVTVQIKDDGTARTLSREAGKGTTFFTTKSSGTGFVMKATTPGNIILDGTTTTDVKETSIKTLLSLSGVSAIDGVAFKNNGTDSVTKLNGAFIYQGEGDTTVTNCTFDKGISAKGGAIYLVSNSTMEIIDSVFTNNKTVSGNSGVIYISADAKGELSGVTFKDNSSAGNAGVTTVDGSLIADNCLFENNQAAGAAGTIQIPKAASVVVTNSIFKNNNADGKGGAFFVRGVLNVDNTTFEGNSATNGGALYIAEGAVTLNDTEDNHFTKNSSSDGGAIYAEKGTLTISGYNFNENNSTEQAGAISIQMTAKLTATETNFIGNHAKTNGGAINLGCTDANIVHVLTDCNFVNNASGINADGTRRNGNGGAIYLKEKSVLEVRVAGDDTYQFSGNTAYHGSNTVWGSVAVGSSNAVLKYSVDYDFANNTHETNAGLGIGIGKTKDAATITEIPSIREDDGGNEGGEGGEQGGNEGGEQGGNEDESDIKVATWIALKEAIAAAEANVETTIILTANMDVTEMMVLDTGKKIVLTNQEGTPVTISRIASYTSNIFKLQNGASLTIQGAAADGRNGIVISGQNISTNSDGQSAVNQLIVADTTNTDGQLTIKNVTIKDAYGTAGGAIRVNAGTFTMDNCLIQKVRGTNSTGGGAFFLQNPKSYISNTTFENNQTTGSGGAIFVRGTGILQVTDCVFTGNRATKNGGAIYATGDVSVSVIAKETGTYKFENNTATGSGCTSGYIWGAIANGSSRALAYSTAYTYTGNTHGTTDATGVGVGGTGDSKTVLGVIEASDYTELTTLIANANAETPTNILLLGNIVVEARMDFTDKNIVLMNAPGSPVKITKTTTISEANLFNIGAGTNLTIQGAIADGRNGIVIDGEGTAAGSGGAMLYATDGKLTIKNATIQNGYKGAGAGLRMNKGTLVVDNCLFQNNAATNIGGALLLDGNNNNVEATISNSTFDGNSTTSTSSGGAIHARSKNNKTCTVTITITSCTFTNNTPSGTKDGLYAGGTAVITVDGKGLSE